MNATEVALMIPSLSAAEISPAMKLLESDDATAKPTNLSSNSSIDCPAMKVLGGKSAVSALTPVGLLDSSKSFRRREAECLPIVIIQRTSCR
jgi:hypothetical protein